MVCTLNLLTIAPSPYEMPERIFINECFPPKKHAFITILEYIGSVWSKRPRFNPRSGHTEDFKNGT